MGKSVTIEVKGVSYPCRMTMGAMLRFKRETGREVSELDSTCLSDLAVLLWCCVASAASADGLDFSLSLLDFCDRLSEADMAAMVTVLQGEETGEQKKSQ